MTPPGSPSAAKSFEESSAAVTESKSEGDDYVWDVFYHRPTKLSEWNAIANIGTLCVHIYSQRLLLSCSVFLLLNGWHRTGLPPSTTDPYDSDSDTEPEDEADEDSNGMLSSFSNSGCYGVRTPCLQRKSITKTTIRMKRMTVIQAVRCSCTLWSMLVDVVRKICSMNSRTTTKKSMSPLMKVNGDEMRDAISLCLAFICCQYCCRASPLMLVLAIHHCYDHVNYFSVSLFMQVEYECVYHHSRDYNCNSEERLQSIPTHAPSQKMSR